MSESRRERGLGANTAYTAASVIAGIVIALVISPFIVHQLGLRTFGFWAAISAVSQYAGLLDFGIGAGLARHIAVHQALGEHDRISALGASAIAVTFPIAIGVVVAGAGVVAAIPSDWSTTWPSGWELAVVLVCFALACMIVASTFQAFPRGLNRWDLQALPGLSYQATFAATTVPILLSGYGVGGLGVASAIAGVVMLSTAYWVQRSTWRRPIWHGSRSRHDAGHLLRYGANLQISALTSVVNSQADKPLILISGGSLEFVGLYELASRAALQLRTLPMSALGPLAMRLASETAGKGLELARAPYDWAYRNVLILAVGPLFAFYGVGYPMMMAWLGVDFETSSIILLVLGAGYAANFATGSASALGNALGRPDLERNYCLLSLAMNVSLSATLGAIFGPWGIVAATGTALMVSSLWFLHRIQSWLADGTPWTSAAPAQSRSALVLGLAIGAATVSATRLISPETRLECLALGAAGTALTVLFWIAFVPTARQLVASRLGRSVASRVQAAD